MKDGAEESKEEQSHQPDDKTLKVDEHVAEYSRKLKEAEQATAEQLAKLKEAETAAS